MLKKLARSINEHAILILMLLICITSGFLFWIQREEANVFISKPRYHFYLIAQNSVDPFWKELRRGLEDAAKEQKVAVEFNAPRFNDPEEERRFLDIAVTSEVDGIITHVSSDIDFTELINKAVIKGIPVVTLENDDKDSNRNSFVGTNSFEIGKAAAELMIKATAGRANIAVIVSNDLNLDTISQNLKMNGFLSTIKDFPGMKVVKTYTSKMGILSAEEITQSIVSGNDNINAIFTTSSTDTIGSAQLVVDRNKVGRITIVGYGDTEDILRYISKDIIYGTVMSDPYRMGYESINALIDIKEQNNVSTFIDTGVKVITKDNVEEYMQKSAAIAE
ncbi:MAG TPA: sugar-binding protein [Negativicutes bacterium]|nr:sugar-binding protein [Negativicutes bacterium]